MGLTASDKTGPLVVLGDDNHIEGNKPKLINIDGVGRGVGRGSLIVYGDRNQIVGNTANDSVLNGIMIDVPTPWCAGTSPTTTATSSRSGTASWWKRPRSATTPQTRTRALGISAVAGVTDLGGNTASGNGNPLQCQNVFCQ